jgi:hypothetical protein
VWRSPSIGLVSETNVLAQMRWCEPAMFYRGFLRCLSGLYLEDWRVPAQDLYALLAVKVEVMRS